MANEQEINPKNLKRLCWANGLTVVQLCRKIRKSRNTVYAAARNCSRYPVAYGLMRIELIGGGRPA